VRLLLDTHALIWALLGSGELTDRVRRMLGDPSNEIYVSAASAWEIAVKHRIGKLPEARDVVLHLAAHIRKARFASLPISLDHALAAGALAGPHKDPFDRMLIAQARLEDLAVVTIDPVFRACDLSVVW
jgi:PIN domain nuclease of toxin-antitoxin system